MTMIYKLIPAIILTLSTYTKADNIFIPSKALPENISIEKYNKLILEHRLKTTDYSLPKEKFYSNSAKPSSVLNNEARKNADITNKAKEEAANKKAEARKIASSAKRDFENKIKRAWHMPLNSSGQRATARVKLSDSGSVISIVVNASDPDVKTSIEQAVRSAAPYPMPSDPDARREARSFTASFKVE